MTGDSGGFTQAAEDFEACEFRGPIPFDSFNKAAEITVQDNGGWDKIENGGVVAEGNNEMSKSAAGGGNQTRAQYGRFKVLAFERLLLKLEGRKKIDAFVDVGHGIGTAVLHAGLTRHIPARGIEIMQQRNLIANLLKHELENLLCKDHIQLDMSQTEFKEGDFTWAVQPGRDEWTRQRESWNVETGRDEELRNWVSEADVPLLFISLCHATALSQHSAPSEVLSSRWMQ